MSPVPRPRCRHRRSAGTLRAARQAAPGCPASPGRESATTNLSSGDLAPTLRTCPRSAGSESGKRTAGPPPRLPRGEGRKWARDSPASTCQLPARARFPLGRGDRRAAAFSPPPREPGASGARAGVVPLPPQAGRWSAACAALPSPPHSPRCTPKPGFGGSRWRSHPAGREREAGTVRGGRRLRGPAAPRRVFCVCTHRERRREEGAGGARGRSERAPANERAGGGAGRGARGAWAEPSLPSIVCDWLARGAGRGGVCRG